MHSRYGEIDIIAVNQEKILFVEVKTRMEGFLYEGKTAVTREKQKRILKTAFLYLSEHKYPLQPRFDVAEIYITKQKKVYINYLENAYGENALSESDLW